MQGRRRETHSTMIGGKRINEVNTEFPVILNEKGGLMDGGHRLARALLEGRKTIKAVRFAQTPEPDVIEEIR